MNDHGRFKRYNSNITEAKETDERDSSLETEEEDEIKTYEVVEEHLRGTKDMSLPLSHINNEIRSISRKTDSLSIDKPREQRKKP